MNNSENTIILSPIGEGNYIYLKQMSDMISQIFGCPTEMMYLLENQDFALDRGRHQYHSTPILDRLAEKAPNRAVRVLALTDVDLFIPILTHVYGEAQLNGKACIVSTYRMEEGLSYVRENPIFIDRLAKEAIHELGHTFGLTHCPEKGCMMHYSRSIRDVDTKSNQPCRYCRVLLNDAMKRLGRPAVTA